MATHLQDILVYLIVGAAIFYLVRHLWLSTRGEAGCGSCSSGCGKKGQVKPGEERLVQIELGGTWKN